MAWSGVLKDSNYGTILWGISPRYLCIAEEKFLSYSDYHTCQAKYIHTANIKRNLAWLEQSMRGTTAVLCVL